MAVGGNKVLEDFTFPDIFEWLLIWILGFYLKMKKEKNSNFCLI